MEITLEVLSRSDLRFSSTGKKQMPQYRLESHDLGQAFQEYVLRSITDACNVHKGVEQQKHQVCSPPGVVTNGSLLSADGYSTRQCQQSHLPAPGL